MKGTSKLVDVKYVGPYGEALVDPDGLGEVSVVFEETIQVPEDVARSLLEQPANWARPLKLLAVKEATG